MESKRCCACCRSIKKRWATSSHQRGWILTESGPHRCDRKEICEIEGMKDNAPDVPISISRQTPAPGFDRIHRFQAAGESQILNRFDNERRGFIDTAAIRIQADNNGGVKSELNIPGGGDTHGLLRIGR